MKERVVRSSQRWPHAGFGAGLIHESLSPVCLSVWLVRGLRESGRSVGGIDGVCGSAPSLCGNYVCSRKSDKARCSVPACFPRGQHGCARATGRIRGPPGGPVSGAAFGQHCLRGSLNSAPVLDAAPKIFHRRRGARCLAVVELLGGASRPAEEGPAGQGGRDSCAMLAAATRWLPREGEAAPLRAGAHPGCFPAARVPPAAEGRAPAAGDAPWPERLQPRRSSSALALPTAASSSSSAAPRPPDAAMAPPEAEAAAPLAPEAHIPRGWRLPGARRPP